MLIDHTAKVMFIYLKRSGYSSEAHSCFLRDLDENLYFGHHLLVSESLARRLAAMPTPSHLMQRIAARIQHQNPP